MRCASAIAIALVASLQEQALKIAPPLIAIGPCPECRHPPGRTGRQHPPPQCRARASLHGHPSQAPGACGRYRGYRLRGRRTAAGPPGPGRRGPVHDPDRVGMRAAGTETPCFRYAARPLACDPRSSREAAP